MTDRQRVALVTGGARRVGRVIALHLARRGFAVAVHHHTSGVEAAAVVAEISAAGGRAIAVAADQRDERQVVAAVADVVLALGGLDVLVNSAAAFPPDGPASSPDGAGGGAIPAAPAGSPPDISAAAFADVLAANAIGPFVFAREAARAMQARGGGRIINIGDIHGQRPLAGYLAYSASKAALHSITLALARALAPTIAVNAILPGVILAPENLSAAASAAILRRTPSGRHGTPADILPLIDLLVDASCQLTGQLIAVDGGRSIA